MRRLTEDQVSEVDGFVIIGPEMPADLASHTFGKTMGTAWHRHIGYQDGRAPGDLAILRGRWAARGYRPVPAKLTVTIPALAQLMEKADG